ncbi:hypothetical protein PFNF54_02593 [Plasmodium falciparum NF54]|uniref:Uncharacterized protein n=1 Tax=Plasmodium falciparum (isolate NF54) TaxID=5843 RepID=W7KFN0_PLAFO|nr:hypothetical protein PFNF54_02593 [Plasmodium falciparum NF54]
MEGEQVLFSLFLFFIPMYGIKFYLKLGKLFVYFTLYNNSIYEYVLMLEYGAMKMDVYFCHCIG